MSKQIFFIMMMYASAYELIIAAKHDEAQKFAQQRTKAEAQEEEELIDYAQTRVKVIQLVDKAADFLKKNDVVPALSAFTHSTDFLDGQIYSFVFKTNGVCIADGSGPSLLWKNLIDLRSEYGIPFVKNFIDLAHNGGGWSTYRWRNTTKISYVKEIIKNDTAYVIGAGYYPHSKHDKVVNLVKSGVQYFNDVKSQGRSIQDAFSSFNYSMGRFVIGDLYLFVLDFNGRVMARAGNPDQVGLNDLYFQYGTGTNIVEEIINKFKNEPQSNFWIIYTMQGAVKKAYVERIEDINGKSFFIGCGYYPEANAEKTIELVKKGYAYLKEDGVSPQTAFQEFTNRSNINFRYGDLYLIVYNEKGICLAHGNNFEFVGQNFFNIKDQQGKYYVQEILKKAQKGGGFVQSMINNALKQEYVEKIVVDSQEYIIVCGFYPINKEEVTRLLLMSAVDYLENNTIQNSFDAFSQTDGKFIIGDFDITVYDTSGLCYVSGDKPQFILKNMIKAKDDYGKSYVKIIVNTAKRKIGKVTYKMNNGERVAYVQKIRKNGKSFVVTSSFTK